MNSHKARQAEAEDRKQQQQLQEKQLEVCPCNLIIPTLITAPFITPMMDALPLE